MKFFTFEWWSKNQIPRFLSRDPHLAYQRHFDAIRHRLTPSLVRLNDEASLHDSEISGFRWDSTTERLRLRLSTDDGSGGARTIHLTFMGVREFKFTANDRPALPGPEGFGQLGYWEVDIHRSLFEFRGLFSSALELRVIFADVRMKILDHT